MIAEKDWVWQGHPGHFCCSDQCAFFMATRVGNILISTIGEWFPEDDKMKPLKFNTGDMYETEVLRCIDGDAEPDYCAIVQSPIEYVHHEGYKTARAAHEGHMRICYKVANGELS